MTKRQLHFRVSEREYHFLVQCAAAGDETLAAVLRRLIRAEIRAAQNRAQQSGTVPVPNLLHDTPVHAYISPTTSSDTKALRLQRPPQGSNRSTANGGLTSERASTSGFGTHPGEYPKRRPAERPAQADRAKERGRQ